MNEDFQYYEEFMKEFKYQDTYDDYQGYESLYLVEKLEKYTGEQKEIFDNAVPGDVLWCHMPFNEATIMKIPVGHRERPYVVAKKTKNQLICYQCSTKFDSKKRLPRHKLIVADLDSAKCSMICLHRLFYINISQIIEPFTTLTKDERDRINRKIQIMQYHTEAGKRMIPFGPPGIEQWDLIKYEDNKYYVLRKEHRETWLGYEYSESEFNSKYAAEVDIIYHKGYVNVETGIELEENKCELIGIFDSDNIAKIEAMEQKYERAKKQQANLIAQNKKKRVHLKYTYQPGTILAGKFDPDNEYIYLYKKNNQETVYDLNSCLIETKNIKGMKPVGYAWDDEMQEVFDFIKLSKNMNKNILKELEKKWNDFSKGFEDSQNAAIPQAVAERSEIATC